MSNFKSLQIKFCSVFLLLIGGQFFVPTNTLAESPAETIIRPGGPGGFEGLHGKVRIVVDPDTGQVTLLGDPADTAIVQKTFEEISKKSSRPKVERILLNSISGEKIAETVQELYDVHYAETQGAAIIRSLGSPNGLYVFGTPQAIKSVRALTKVMGFVHKNHPKLETMLLALGESNAANFRSAIKRTGKTLSKMRSFKDKQPKRYAASVELWKVKSEIEILTARLANQNDPQLRSQLDALVEVFVDKRRQLLEIEKRNIVQRLERTNRLLETIETDRDAFVKKNLRSIDKTIKQLNSGRSAKKQTGSKQ